ncbi:beta-1,3-galactosyltransferase 5-like [Ostrea edulis]|uniref:beta-1,3-galactosyltransferase 5-like n=1 Tax=Ostrea edulis TaxID=37623 RepID=UPI0020965B6E|nr:beta-1,3-galactosyltransferase 5-like [Ostrea edulis]XP_055996337.1 beta-1,3-galactosyltransferase 5-like [Ostrea edulis]XP_055996338.1 beta-1,3-galactosyltransferase 5-like [Ostrea edulis]
MIELIKKRKGFILRLLLVVVILTLCFLLIDEWIECKKQLKKLERAKLMFSARHNIDGTISIHGTLRPKRCVGCFKYNYRMLKEYPATCQNQENIQLVVLILTTPKALKRRMVIRDTWLSYAKKNYANVRYAFLLGAVNDVDIQETIDLEDKHYRDFIQGDFPDNYYTITLKTLLGYHWAAKHCPNDAFIVKTDDDVFINIPAILGLLRTHSDILQHSIAGFCRKDIEPVRDIESKYHVSYSEYPLEKFNGYCSGTGYLTSINVVKHVAQISENIPFFHLEDVYVAFCMEELNFSLYHINGFNTVYDEKKHTNLCMLRTDSVFVLHNFEKEPSFLLEIWNAIC